jgi:HEAT repeat protein
METTATETDASGQAPQTDDPHKEIKAKLADFLLSLIQAFLRTGFYTSDHPEAKKAKLGLYEDFGNLFTGEDELTFMVRDDPEGKSILIEGVLPEIYNLNSLMLRGMAEMYGPKFAKFLERKDLISLTLKSTMTREEFTNFVDVMGEPIFVDTHEKSDKQRFSQTLKDRGIFNISYIFSEELLAVKRKIPWRSQIALSRLMKDFRMIPLFFDLDEEGIKKVRRQIIQDVARHIQDAGVIFPVLMNTDLAETKEFKESEINEEIIACLSDELLIKISRTLLKEDVRQGESGPPQGKAVGLAGQIASCLNLREIEARDPILEEYFKHKLIPFEQLPEATQRRIKFVQFTEKFLRNIDSFLTQFDEIQDAERYLKAARSVTRIIPELIRRDRYEEILKIVTHIDRQVHEKTQLSPYAGQILEQIETGEILRALKGKFLTGNNEIRLAIAPILVKLGAGSVPHLLSLLRQSTDHLVRKHACEILLQVDSSAINHILDELNKRGFSVKSAIDIIRVLGEIKSDEWIQPFASTLRTYLNHENPRLREEALGIYYKIMGSDGEKVYLNILDDPDIGVKKRAIRCLSGIKSNSGLEKFLEVLKKAEDFPSDKDLQIEPSLFNALSFYGNIEMSDMVSLEDFLIETLDRRLSLGPLKFLKKKKIPLSEGAIAAICETLGKIGTNKSYAILQKLEKQKDRMWMSKAEEALIKISERQEDRGSIKAP